MFSIIQGRNIRGSNCRRQYDYMMGDFILGIVVAAVINLLTALFSRRKALTLLPWLLLYITLHGAYVFLSGSGRDFLMKHNQWWAYPVVAVIALLFWKFVNIAVNSIAIATNPGAALSGSIEGAKTAKPGLKIVIALTMINPEKDLTVSAAGRHDRYFQY